MSLISNVYSFKFFIESLGCLCSKEEVGRMPRRCAATNSLTQQQARNRGNHTSSGLIRQPRNLFQGTAQRRKCCASWT